MDAPDGHAYVLTALDQGTRVFYCGRFPTGTARSSPDIKKAVLYHCTEAVQVEVGNRDLPLRGWSVGLAKLSVEWRCLVGVIRVKMKKKEPNNG